MLSNNLLTALNDQIKHEFYSAYFYLAMSAWAESNNMPGAAKWLGKQAHEEAGHAMKLYGMVRHRKLEEYGVQFVEISAEHRQAIGDLCDVLVPMDIPQ